MLNDLKFNTKREKKNIITEFFENVAPNKEFETSNHQSSHSGTSVAADTSHKKCKPKNI